MPEINEIKYASELGIDGTYWYMWQACLDCGKERWVALRKGVPKSLRCRPCARKWGSGENGSNWRGGEAKYDGYIFATVLASDFFFPMAIRINKNGLSGYVAEHRLVIARHLGRCLHFWEIVHHKNGIRDDNRIENLQLVQEMQHNQITYFENRVRRLEKNNGELAQRITLLEAELLLYNSEFAMSMKLRNLNG